MIYAKVNPEAIEVLETELKKPKDGNWYRRLKIIHLSSQGYTVPQLSCFFDLSSATVRDYIKRYNQGGLAALKPNYGNGRPVKINLSKEEWEELLHQSPCQLWKRAMHYRVYEKLHTGAQNWTQQMLRKYLALYHHVLVAQSTLSTLIQRLGIRWNRGKLKVTSPDPLYQVKRERIDQLKKKACKRTEHALPAF
ncbi:helix-turn-helix domain-containing protein [bacterium]|nr:helix-turn-helix domain-containing protein [bacterium]